MNFSIKNHDHKTNNRKFVSKTLSLSIVLLLTSLVISAQNITVSVDNVMNSNGKVVFALHKADTFMKGQGIQNATVEIKDGKAIATFKDVKSGTYAIMVLHDENENNQMDFNDNGMPKESYGMSNNSMSFGPPQFADAKFEVGKDNMDIKIRF